MMSAELYPSKLLVLLFAKVKLYCCIVNVIIEIVQVSDAHHFGLEVIKDAKGNEGF